MTYTNGSNGNGHSNGRSASFDRRKLPYSADSEASILGGIILQNDILDELPELEPEHFFELKHRVVFGAMRNLRASGSPIDTVTLEDEIARAGQLDSLGGPGFFGELVLRVPTPDNVLDYAAIVRQHHRNRQVIVTLASALERAQHWPHDPAELLAETVGDIQRIELASSGSPGGKLITVRSALVELRELASAPIYPTPFPTLNEAIGFGGLLGTQVYTVAAGTGRGKTSWVSALASHAATTVPVLVASWEMKPGYFVARNAAGLLGFHSNDIIRGNVPLERVESVMACDRILFLHKPTLAELKRAVDQVSQKFGAAPLVVVDYLQKLADFIARRMARPDARAATSEASESLCDIGDSSKSAIVAVSAIGRGNNRKTANPRKLEPYELVDVAKESGAVEYDGAGLIVLSLSSEYDGDERIATITLAKARFGEECHIDARYHGARGAWRDNGRCDRERSDSTVDTSGLALALRESVFRALKNSRTPLSKNEIHKASGKNKTAILSEVDAMLDRGLIQQIATKSGPKFALPDYTPISRQIPLSEERA